MGKYMKHGLTKELLEDLYVKQNLSDREIGKRYGIGERAVAYHRRINDIATLKPSDRIAIDAKKNGLKDITQLTDSELIELYNKVGMYKIGEMYGCSKIPIRDRLRKLGIAPLSKTQRLLIRCPDKLTEFQEQVIIGSLLGDAGVYDNEPRNGIPNTARYSEFHCIKQKSYLEWKHSVLTPFSNNIRKSDKTLDDGRVAKGFSFYTCFLPVFLNYRNMFYNNRKKFLPVGLMETLTPLSLTVWYMDDGNLYQYYNPDYEREFTIASSFIKPEIEVIVSTLNRRFNLDIEAKERENIHILHFKNQDKMFDLIKDHIRPEFSYKVPLHLRFKLPFNNKPHLVNVLDSFNKDTFIKMTEEEKNRVLDDMMDYWQIRGFPYPESYDNFDRGCSMYDVSNKNIDLTKPIKTGNTEGAGCCISFFENFWTAKRINKKSPVEVFSDRKLLRRALLKSIYHRTGVGESDLRMELQTFGGVHNFRPVIAKCLYDRYCPEGGSVLDPCSGYGGRLLGFYSSKAIRYVGVDACCETITGLRHMRCMLERNKPDKKVDFHYGAFEDVEITEKFDMVFTSPPYYCKEIYGQDEFQCHNRYKSYADWLYDFLYVLVDKSIALLKLEGYLVFNVVNIIVGREEHKIADDLESYLKSKMVIETVHFMEYGNHYNDNKKVEPIFVCRKQP